MKESTVLKNEWCKYYDLTPLSPSKFYKIVGCYILGFEIIKIPNRGIAQPHLAVYPLWKDDIKQCLKTPYQLYGLENKRGLQVKLPIAELLEERDIVFGLFDEYIGFDIKKNINSNDMLKLMDKCDRFMYNNPWRLMDVSDAKIYQSAYIGDKDMFDKCIEELTEIYLRINKHIELVESRYGDLNERRVFLQSLFDKREAIIDKVKVNAVNSKIKKYVELI